MSPQYPVILLSLKGEVLWGFIVYIHVSLYILYILYIMYIYKCSINVDQINLSNKADKILSELNILVYYSVH